jgi:hypothetical protein
MKTWTLDPKGSLAWIADPAETMQRASVALAFDGGCLVCDPVDAPGLDEALAPIGPVRGVCQLLDRHGRDCEAVAARHGAPRLAPAELASIAAFAEIETIELYRARRWHESALWLPSRRLLVVAEAVGTLPFFLTRRGDRLGMHTLARFAPPRVALARVDPDTIAVGHGAPLIGGASRELARVLAHARTDIPRSVVTTLGLVIRR